ncbi:hypothetical protein GNI_183540 [Gregarina niphandrodes]|uniref:Uncharacterized protein n=1 Tax=Gregarina niphandrodes TaxID=110365 RepID=A0A023AY17_GRENI|nr:hypothetical protein GNI_183540 [Gregarina niphandrodes]EZG43185.1 hypothetical protein GNI_183540 [Gregarina niphandrodes]|eukprot:XP_011133553.1 hypothetical protein GNI_183540 [Gregarina niphandrodes]
MRVPVRCPRAAFSFAAGILAVNISSQPVETGPQATAPLRKELSETESPARTLCSLIPGSLAPKSALLEGEAGGFENTVYWDNTCTGLTALAVIGQVFEGMDDARAQLNELLSEDEWKKLKGITQMDLWDCALVYVELGAIISMFIDCPFGDVTKTAQMMVADWLREAGGVRIRNNWVTGCLLQRAGVSTGRLIDFVIDTLAYKPTERLPSLECLAKSELRYWKYSSRSHTRDSRELLLRREAMLPTMRITAREFAEDIFPLPTITARELRRIGKGPLPAEPTVSFPQIRSVLSPGNSHPLASVCLEDVCSKVRKLLGCREMKLAAIEDQDFEACSLDYVELGAIINKHVRDAFGRTCGRILDMTATALTETIRSRRVRAWVSGCLLQYAEVPISDLIDLCVHELKFSPPVAWRLECLRRHSDWERGHRKQKLLTPEACLHQLLCGLDKKISLPQFKRLMLMSGREQVTYVREHFLSFQVSLKLSGGHKRSAAPPATQAIPNESSAATFGTKRRKPSAADGCSPSLTAGQGGSVTDRTVLDPAMMYCHPDDLSEFVDWVELSQQGPLQLTRPLRPSR